MLRIKAEKSPDEVGERSKTPKPFGLAAIESQTVLLHPYSHSLQAMSTNIDSIACIGRSRDV